MFDAHCRPALLTPREEASDLRIRNACQRLRGPASAGRAAPHKALITAVAWAAAALATHAAQAQQLGPLGSSGGLVIPKAHTLSEGTVSLGVSNLPEPAYGNPKSPRSIVLGLGIWEGLEVSGRFAEYSSRTDGFLVGGISDLSLNAKASWAWGDGPTALRLGAGLMDYGGQATNFRSAYAVGTQSMGPWEATLGWGKSDALVATPGQRRALDGVFAGLSYQVTGLNSPAGRWELAAEHDGRQALAGVRWASPAWPALADGRLTMALHRAAANGSAHPGSTVWTLGVSLPLAEREKRFARAEATVPPAQPPAFAPEVLATASARMAQLKQALTDQGLERVCVGRARDGAWVVSYQNRRFGHNEVDALGLVLGLAVEAAPQDLRSLVVLALKQGQPVLTLRTEPTVWRNFLGTGLPGLARGTTQVQRGLGIPLEEVDWVAEEPSRGTWLQLQLTPELAYTVGTEVGMADYSMAARAMATVPLWTGAQFVVAAQQPLSNSRQAAPTGIFASMRQTEGLHTLALHQTWWLGQRAVLGAAVGRFEYGAWGAEGEALVFMPWRDDILRLRGRAVDKTAELPRGAELAGAASYRWTPTPSLAAEVGVQRYNDGSSGPTAVVSRWWGDVGAHLFYRQGGWRKYVGVEFSVPLTPRSAKSWGPVHVQGSPSWKRGLRTMVDNPANYVEPRQVRDLQLTWELETQALNAGRLGPEYVLAQMPRMREAFVSYGPKKP